MVKSKKRTYKRKVRSKVLKRSTRRTNRKSFKRSTRKSLRRSTRKSLRRSTRRRSTRRRSTGRKNKKLRGGMFLFGIKDKGEKEAEAAVAAKAEEEAAAAAAAEAAAGAEMAKLEEQKMEHENFLSRNPETAEFLDRMNSSSSARQPEQESWGDWAARGAAAVREGAVDLREKTGQFAFDARFATEGVVDTVGAKAAKALAGTGGGASAEEAERAQEEARAEAAREEVARAKAARAEAERAEAAREEVARKEKSRTGHRPVAGRGFWKGGKQFGLEEGVMDKLLSGPEGDELVREIEAERAAEAAREHTRRAALVERQRLALENLDIEAILQERERAQKVADLGNPEIRDLALSMVKEMNEKLAAAEAEAARAEAARAEAERLAAEAERLAAQRAAAEAEAARAEAARAEAERLAAQRAAEAEAARATRVEAERVAAERAAARVEQVRSPSLFPYVRTVRKNGNNLVNKKIRINGETESHGVSMFFAETDEFMLDNGTSVKLKEYPVDKGGNLEEESTNKSDWELVSETEYLTPETVWKTEFTGDKKRPEDPCNIEYILPETQEIFMCPFGPYLKLRNSIQGLVGQRIYVKGLGACTVIEETGAVARTVGVNFKLGAGGNAEYKVQSDSGEVQPIKLKKYHKEEESSGKLDWLISVHNPIDEAANSRLSMAVDAFGISSEDSGSDTESSSRSSRGSSLTSFPVAGGAAAAAVGVATSEGGHKDYKIPAVINEDDKFKWCWNDAYSVSKSALGRTLGFSWSKAYDRNGFMENLAKNNQSTRTVRVMRIEEEGKPAAIKIYPSPPLAVVDIAKWDEFKNGWYQKAS